MLTTWATFLSLPLDVVAQKRQIVAAVQKTRQTGTNSRFASGNSALNIPLEIDNNIVLMRVKVNNSKPLKFIFDTGASHTLINSRRAQELGLKSSGRARGTATGGAIRGTAVNGVSLSVQGAEAFNQTIASIAFDAPPGFDFDGIIGYDFINQFIVEIDYQNKTMNLYRPRDYKYSGKGEIVPLLLKGRRTPLARVKIMLDERTAPLQTNLELDTGADGAFLINSPLVKKRKLLEAIPKTVQEGAVGTGGEQTRRLGRIKAAQIGRFVFNDPTIALSLDTTGAGASAEDGLIGGEIFRRFKVILDYSRSRMILEPNSNLNDLFEHSDL